MIKMTLMWSMSSFCCYLLNFLNKYMEGSIYSVFYIEGCAGSLAIVVGSSVYRKAGKKLAFLFSFGCALISGFGIFSLESRLIRLP